LAELRSDNWARVIGRLGRLMSYKPHPDDADVGLVIRDLQNHSNPGVSMRAKQLWKKWSAIVDGSAGTTTADTSKPAGKPADPFATPDEKGRQMRTWTDVTGSFKVEAQFVKMDGSNVVLKRKDGKEINVPVSRLSNADQTIVEELKKVDLSQNPFQ
jgi:hypothetical protein